MSLLRKWGFGAELIFEGGRATANMGRAQRAVMALRGSFDSLRSAGSSIRTMIQNVGALALPLGAGFGFAAAQASSLAGNLEAQKLTMRVLVGDMGKADELLAKIRENAAATPFQEGDLIEGSKRLLRLTGSNVDRNIDLLKTMETMAALNPTKSVVDGVEALLDATSGGGFERLKEFGLSFKAEDFKAAGRPGGEAWANAVIEGIQSRMLEVTRGEDLVGALAQTFQGRLSTFRDSIENALKPIGETINARIGPALVFLTELIKGSTDDLVAGVNLALGRVFGLWERFGQPVADRMLAWWRGLGGEGRQNVIAFLTVIGALAAAAIPLGGALISGGLAFGALAAGGSAVVSILSAAWTAVTAVAGLIGGPLTAAAGVGLAALSAVAVVLAVLFQRSNVVANILPLYLGKAFATVGARAEQFRVLIVSMWGAFRESMAPVLRALSDYLQPAFDQLINLAIDLVSQFTEVTTTTNDAAQIGRFFGRMITGFLIPALALLTLAVQGVIFGLTLTLPLVTTTIQLFRRFGLAVLGLAQGTFSTSEAFQLMSLAIVHTVATMARGVVAVLTGVLTAFLSNVAAKARAIPFLRDTPLARLDATAADLGAAVDRQIEEAIAEVDRRALDLERKRAERANVNVNVEQAPVEVEAKVTTEVCVDGQELARANGAAAVRSGERGTGDPLPARQRGRVLRRGLTVTALSPAEAF